MSDEKINITYQRFKYYYNILLDTKKSIRIINFLKNDEIINFLICNKGIYNSLKENKILLKNAIKSSNLW
jgi:hypothetical protein